DRTEGAVRLVRPGRAREVLRAAPLLLRAPRLLGRRLVAGAATTCHQHPRRQGRHTRGAGMEGTRGDDVDRQVTVPYYEDDTATLYLGDAADVMSQMPDASVDCIVTS